MSRGKTLKKMRSSPFVSVFSLATLVGGVMISFTARATDCSGVNANSPGCYTPGQQTLQLPTRVPTPPPRPTDQQPEPDNAKAGSGEPAPTDNKDSQVQAPNPPGDSNEASSEDSQIAAAVQACAAAADSTMAECSAQKSSGAMGQAMAALNQATNAMNGSGAAQACGAANSAVQSANAAMMAMKATCSSSYDSCRSACQINVPSGSSSYAAYKQAKANCNSASSLIAGIDQNMAQFQAARATNAQCVSDAASSAAAALAAQTYAASQTCANASFAASNPGACGSPNFGSTPSMPFSGSGGSGSSVNSGLITGNEDFASDSGGGSGADLGGPGGFGGGAGGGPGGLDPSGHRRGALGAGGNGPLPGSPGDGMSNGNNKSANKSGPPAKPGRPASTLSTNVLGGRAGASPGSAFSAAVSKDPGNGTVSKTGLWIPPKVPDDPNKINLDRFRPGLQGYRMPTGLEKSTSELLGSHVDIWKQVNLRYLSLSMTLKP